VHAATGSIETKPDAQKMTDEERLQELEVLIDHFSALTGIPWYWLAAINQYERTMNKVIKSRQAYNDRLVSIYYSEEQWAGMFNPDPNDTNPASIRFFGGIGSDGNQDGKADRNDPIDVMHTMTNHLLRYGITDKRLLTALWEHYHNPRSVQRIEQFARMYRTFGKLDLSKRAFPVPVRSHYSYRSTWGAARGWGGRRIHEGTDIFADYGTPVRSTCYGIVEVMGWNRYGGWRIGIRDIHNVYHYFAHLSGFHKELREGDLVEPGQTIGWVGSSGYGKPGTQGKFPPHLHYGMYRDTGLSEWSFDPYPYLRRWEKSEQARR
jgi:murein DD-endopeptidase MepM/ murein hydrolase activator NlpD